MPAFIAWYALSPLLFKWLDNSKKMACATLAAAVASPFLKNWMYTFADAQFVNWNFFSLLYVFLLGALSYFITVEKKFKRGILYGIFIGIVGYLLGNRSGFFIFGIGFYFLVTIGNMLPITWQYVKMNTIIKECSASTYSIYLTHWFIIELFGNRLKELPWEMGYVIFIVGSCLLGYLAYRYVEQPIYLRLTNKKTD